MFYKFNFKVWFEDDFTGEKMGIRELSTITTSISNAKKKIDFIMTQGGSFAGYTIKKKLIKKEIVNI